jgi:hypothetical protein
MKIDSRLCFLLCLTDSGIRSCITVIRRLHVGVSNEDHPQYVIERVGGRKRSSQDRYRKTSRNIGFSTIRRVEGRGAGGADGTIEFNSSGMNSAVFI